MIKLNDCIKFTSIFLLPQLFQTNTAGLLVCRVKATELKWPAAQSESEKPGHKWKEKTTQSVER